MHKKLFSLFLALLTILAFASAQTPAPPGGSGGGSSGGGPITGDFDPILDPGLGFGNFCDFGLQGTNLEFEDFFIYNEALNVSTPYWSVSDTILVAVEVQNEGSVSVPDVVVEIGLFNDQGVNVADLLDFTVFARNPIADIGDLGDGDEDSVIFEFMIPPEIDSGYYALAVKSYSELWGEGIECVDETGYLSYDTYEVIQISGDDFIRGDANDDGVVNIADADMIFRYLNGVELISCEDAADVNDDGSVDVSDAVYLLSYLFNGGAVVPAPFPGLGADLTGDSLICN